MDLQVADTIHENQRYVVWCLRDQFAMALEQNRFLQPHQPPAPRRKRWGGCWGGMSFFSKQKGGKRIVPASRVPEANALSNQQNGPQPGGMPNQIMGIAMSILAPPSSPASFSNSGMNSGIPSTAQSPNCFLSANSPRGPSSTMFVTGPYAHETQLVSPPVFSTFTTEPSTAPLTPPPELAHLTTPSSPDVPYAHFLLSSAKMRSNEKSNYGAADLQAAYSLSPGSPASALRSPISRADGLSSSFNEREFPPQWSPSNPSQEPFCRKSDSSRFLGLETVGVPTSRQDTNFFCPETFAQFYDQSSFSNAVGRLSISKESDAYSNAGNGYQNRQNKVSRPDTEELDAYRASFGFSADEIITTPNYVEISDVLDDSFSMAPIPCNKPVGEGRVLTPQKDGPETERKRECLSSSQLRDVGMNHTDTLHSGAPVSFTTLEDQAQQKRYGEASRSLHNLNVLSDDDDIFSKMGSSRVGRTYQIGSSNSDAEIEYRRGRSLREGRSRRGES